MWALQSWTSPDDAMHRRRVPMRAYLAPVFAAVSASGNAVFPSVTQLAAELAGWMGLSATELPTVLPNIGPFPAERLGCVSRRATRAQWTGAEPRRTGQACLFAPMVDARLTRRPRRVDHDVPDRVDPGTLPVQPCGSLRATMDRHHGLGSQSGSGRTPNRPASAGRAVQGTRDDEIVDGTRGRGGDCQQDSRIRLAARQRRRDAGPIEQRLRGADRENGLAMAVLVGNEVDHVEVAPAIRNADCVEAIDRPSTPSATRIATRRERMPPSPD